MATPFGLPARTEFTPIPNLFFGPYLDNIQELVELKIFLRLLFLLHRKRGFPQFVTLSELSSDPSLLKALKEHGGQDSESVKKVLEGDLARGLFLRLPVKTRGSSEELYFLNTPTNQRALERIEAGELSLPELPVIELLEMPQSKRPNIFDLYENNIGILTPIIAEELKEAEELYPYSWIEDAFREAVAQNKRGWRYISRILQRWKEEGRDHGEPRRHPEKTDPKEYLRRYGKYIPRKYL